MSSSASEALHLAGEWDVYPPAGAKQKLRRMVKQAVFFAYLHCGWIQVRDAVEKMLGRSRIVIIYYHRVGWIDQLSKPASAFRADLRYLKKRYRCVTMWQLARILARRRPLREKLAVITFDDGYRDNYTSAFAELKRAGIPATFFVSTGFIQTQKVFPHDERAVAAGRAARSDWPKMNWQELREMQAAGMEIGSHTVEHTNMGQANEEVARQEARESLATLNRELGERPRCFCFPWGKPCDVSDTAVRMVREAGYFAAVTTSAGTVHRGDDLFRLRRIDVGNGHMHRLAVRAMIEGFGCGWLARYLRR